MIIIPVPSTATTVFSKTPLAPRGPRVRRSKKRVASRSSPNRGTFASSTDPLLTPKLSDSLFNKQHHQIARPVPSPHPERRSDDSNHDSIPFLLLYFINQHRA